MTQANPGQSLGQLPHITVLTPCFNGAATIAEAAKSVQDQAYPDVEHIVLDGGPDDGTAAILGGLRGLRHVRQPDDGSHDAMNKGVRLASGEIIGFLNSDDFYMPGILHDVGRAFADDPQLDIVTTGTVVFTESTNHDRNVVVARDHRHDDGFWLSELAFGAPGFNGRFYRRRLFDRLGNFNISYDFSADRDFLTRVALSDAKRLTLPRFGYCYRSHLRSRTLNTTSRNVAAFAQEHMIEADHFAGLAATADQRRHFLGWRAFSGAKLCYLQLSAGHIGSAVATAWRLTRGDCIWPSRLPLAFGERRAVRNAEARSTAQFHDLAGGSDGLVPGPAGER